MAQTVELLKKKHGQNQRIVLILDSIEKVRGTTINAHDVEASLEILFAGHAAKLRFEFLHVVYTSPPWLKIRTPGIDVGRFQPQPVGIRSNTTPSSDTKALLFAQLWKRPCTPHRR